MEKDYVDLLLENDNLRQENTDLKAAYQNEHDKRLNEKHTFYKRNRISRRVTLVAGTFLSIAGIAVGAAFNNFMKNMNQINFGKKALTTLVQNECFHDIIYYDDSVSGMIFIYGNKSIGYEKAMNVIKYNAHSSGISDLDLYIGISQIFNHSVASDLVGEVDKEDINRRCIEIYLEKELEREHTNGR